MVRRLSLCREVAGLVSRCGHAGAEASVEIGSVLRDPEADLGPFDWRVGAVIVHAGEHRGRPRRSVSCRGAGGRCERATKGLASGVDCRLICN